MAGIELVGSLNPWDKNRKDGWGQSADRNCPVACLINHWQNADEDLMRPGRG